MTAVCQSNRHPLNILQVRDARGDLAIQIALFDEESAAVIALLEAFTARRKMAYPQR